MNNAPRLVCAPACPLDLLGSRNRGCFNDRFRGGVAVSDYLLRIGCPKHHPKRAGKDEGQTSGEVLCLAYADDGDRELVETRGE